MERIGRDSRRGGSGEEGGRGPAEVAAGEKGGERG
jgi:hypothetical protein